MGVVLMLIGAVIGAAASWGVSRHYYRRTVSDTADSALAIRLDRCEERDATFLVAMLNAAKPVPRYAYVDVEFESENGKRSNWGAITPSLVSSLRSCADGSLITMSQGRNDIHEHHRTMSLSKRGRENAQYFARTHYPIARFASIDDSEERRLWVFRHEHGREPTEKALGGFGIGRRTGDS